MSRITRRAVAAVAFGVALGGAPASQAATIVLDGGNGAVYESVGDGWFFALPPGPPPPPPYPAPDGVGDADGQALAVAFQAGVVEQRALAEFPLAPLAGVDPNDVLSATITYTIDDVLSGFGPGTAFDTTASDPIDLYSYSADGTIVPADFAPAGAAPLDSVVTGLITDASLAISNAVSFQVDATDALKDLLTGGATHFGVLFRTSDSATGTSLDDQGVPGRQFPFITVEVADKPREAVRVLLKARNGKEKFVWVSKTPALTLPTAHPAVTGATLEIRNPVTLETATLQLPATGWSANAANTVFKFKNPDTPTGTAVKVAVIKASVLKVVAKGTGITLDEATQGSIELSLTVGADGYCSSCSVPTKDEGAAGPEGQYLAKSCPAPPSCP